MIQAKLIVVGGDAKVAEINLKLPCTIGRGKGSTLTLPHPLVSRQHCEVFESNGRLMVRDLGSLNGTFVGSERITESELPPNELLTIGTVTFRAIYDSEHGDTPLPPSAPAAETELTPGKETVRVAAKPSNGQQPEEELEELEDFDAFLVEDDESDSPPSTKSVANDKPKAPAPPQDSGEGDDFGLEFFEPIDEEGGVSSGDSDLGDFLKEFDD